MSLGSQHARKTLAYFELREALREPGCALCTLILKRSMRALESLVYEQVTDPVTRLRLRRSQGLCNWHAWLLTERSSGQAGIAMIYEQLLHDQLEQLRKAQASIRPQTFWQRLKRSVTGAVLPGHRIIGTPCPGCRLFSRTDESGYLKTLLDSLSDAAFVGDLQRAFGLCLPHLHRTMAQYHGHANLPRLLALTYDKLTALQDELNIFIRKSDYRFAREPIGPEADAWKRGIELFVGKPGLFRSQRPEPGGTVDE